jgi:hypothetical protein
VEQACTRLTVEFKSRAAPAKVFSVAAEEVSDLRGLEFDASGSQKTVTKATEEVSKEPILAITNSFEVGVTLLMASTRGWPAKFKREYRQS